ncbi:hypothetical protein QR680_015791 [Steinernema hermaphroditum]|uniref:Histone acetyltransferase n=1 Tax=Steinernema hermaphroditum TaxID=289476 RepID=A0AA39H8Z2_9BILA|nr:hypothetical protein QR680_015791 [Steinernema hermaphroditum]
MTLTQSVFTLCFFWSPIFKWYSAERTIFYAIWDNMTNYMDINEIYVDEATDLALKDYIGNLSNMLTSSDILAEWKMTAYTRSSRAYLYVSQDLEKSSENIVSLGTALLALDRMILMANPVWYKMKKILDLTMKRNRRIQTLEQDPEIRQGEVFLVRRTVGEKEEEAICEVIEVKTLTSANPLLTSSATSSEASQGKSARFGDSSSSNQSALSSSSASAAANTAALKAAEEFAVQRAQHDELEAAVRGIQDFTKSEDDDDDREESQSPVKEALAAPEIPERVTYSIYYVHFVNSDRRLDTWLDRSKFIERKSPDVVVTTPIVPPGDAGTSHSTLMTRSRKRIHEEFHHVQKAYSDMDATTAAMEKAHEEFTKVKNLEKVVYGSYEINVWYFSPFPEDMCKTGKLYICEYCLGYMDDEEEYVCHIRHTCKRRQPPGDEIYRCGNLSVFEVDGRTNKTYCQCLCLLSKLFMDHKTLYFDVDTFLFYILCEVDQRGAHLVGHFSKERNSVNNLACIMILPPYQRKGYGKLLIQISYALSKREGVIGTPEKPLSDLGKISYRSYWWYVLLKLIEENGIEDITVSDLSRNSGIHQDDIVSTMRTFEMIKYWNGNYVVRTNKKIVEQMKIGNTPKLLLHEELLRWTPKTSWNT